MMRQRSNASQHGIGYDCQRLPVALAFMQWVDGRLVLDEEKMTGGGKERYDMAC